jgi:hypothetical protein
MKPDIPPRQAGDVSVCRKRPEDFFDKETAGGALTVYSHERCHFRDTRSPEWPIGLYFRRARRKLSKLSKRSEKNISKVA